MPAPVEGVDGNWRCLSCSNINFSVRDKCNRCGMPRGDLGVGGVNSGVSSPLAATAGGLAPASKKRKPSGMPIEGVDGNWRCPSCSNINFGVRDKCNRCEMPRPAGLGQVPLLPGQMSALQLPTPPIPGMPATAPPALYPMTTDSACLAAMSALPPTSAPTALYPASPLEAQMAQLVQRQAALESQVQGLQAQVRQQAQLLASVGLGAPQQEWPLA